MVEPPRLSTFNFHLKARKDQRDSDDSEEEAEEEDEEEDIEALLDAEEEDEDEMEEEEEESEEDAIERLKTEIGDRYDEETGKVATVQVSDQLLTSLSNTTESGWQMMRTYEKIFVFNIQMSHFRQSCVAPSLANRLSTIFPLYIIFRKR